MSTTNTTNTAAEVFREEAISAGLNDGLKFVTPAAPRAPASRYQLWVDNAVDTCKAAAPYAFAAFCVWLIIATFNVAVYSLKHVPVSVRQVDTSTVPGMWHKAATKAAIVWHKGSDVTAFHYGIFLRQGEYFVANGERFEHRAGTTDYRQYK